MQISTSVGVVQAMIVSSIRDFQFEQQFVTPEGASG
jgi:hypothetical protein